MKKIIVLFIGIVMFLFISRYTMVLIDYKYEDSLKNEILNNTDIDSFLYVNKYDNHYIIQDKDYLYLFNSKFEEIIRISLDKVYKNSLGYAIVYRDKTIMYMDNYMDKRGIIYKYYDIYTYEVIDEVLVEVSNE